MNALPLPMPVVERFARSPELPSLAILEAALAVCETALIAAHPDVAYGARGSPARGSTAMQVHAMLVAGRKLAATLASYREALGREEGRRIRERDRDMPF